MDYYLTKAVDILTSLSNLAFLIPFVGAIRQGRWTRAFLFFWMTWVSFTYHLCDSFGACLFTYDQHHNLDFFFAQWLILITGLYFIIFSPKYPWVERGLIILDAIIIVILQITLNGEMLVQAFLVAAVILLILLYWFIRGSIPKYDIVFLELGVALIVLSVSLYTYQNMLPSQYWSIHSLWHITAALGQYYFLFIKPAAPKFAALDAKVRYNYNQIKR